MPQAGRRRNGKCTQTVETRAAAPMYLLVPVHTIVKPPVLGQGVYSDRQEVLARLPALFEPEEAPEPGRLLRFSFFGMDRTVTLRIGGRLRGFSWL